MLTSVQCRSQAEPSLEEPVPLRVPSEPDECARGYILRVAGRNWCKGKDMANWLGLPGLGQDLDLDPGPAARLLSIRPDALAQMGFEDEEAGWVLGHRMPLNRLHRAARYVCPDCLAEVPYQRRIWSLRQLDVCPRHGRALMNCCPECSGRLSWVGQSTIENCYCGAELNVPGTTAPADDSTGARAVYLHCGLAAPDDGLPSAFTGLPLAALLDLLFFLGRMDLVIADGNPDGLQPREMLTDRRVLNAGARIALGWPESFDNMAGRVRAARPGRRGVMKEYGYLHRFIMRSGKAPYAGLLQNAYASHLARRADVSDRAWPPLLPRPALQMDAMTPMEVQRALGLGRNSFAFLRRQPLWTDIEPVTSARNGTPQFARSDIDALKARLSRLMSPGVADTVLGIGRGRTAQLVEAGLITACHWNRNHRNSEQRSVDVADIYALFDRVRSLATSAPPAQAVTFESLLKMATARRVVTFIDVIRCLLSGEIRGHLADTGTPGLASLAFDRADAEQMMDRLASPAQTGKMVLGQVTRRLGIPAKAVHQLVAEGLLPRPQRVCAYIFDAHAIEAFRNEFTYDSAIARQTRTAVDPIRHDLALVGGRPVTTITMRNGTTSAVYRKAKLGLISAGSDVIMCA